MIVHRPEKCRFLQKIKRHNTILSIDLRLVKCFRRVVYLFPVENIGWMNEIDFPNSMHWSVQMHFGSHYKIESNETLKLITVSSASYFDSTLFLFCNSSVIQNRWVLHKLFSHSMHKLYFRANSKEQITHVEKSKLKSLLWQNKKN